MFYNIYFKITSEKDYFKRVIVEKEIAPYKQY